MPLLFEKTFESLQGETLSELISETNITRTSPGSKTQALLKTVNKKLNRSYKEFDINMLRAFLPYAEGQFLDYLGDMVGLVRGPSQRATVAASSKVVRFYVTTGTFGDINSNLDIFIPSGTLITTGVNSTGTVYQVTTGVFLNRLLSEEYVSVEAVRDGSNSNVGQNTLVFHNFTNYTAATGLLVTNDELVDNGSDTESNTSYRFRIANQTVAAQKANETSVRLALLSVPGVADIVLNKYAQGIGTYEIIIQAVVPNTPDNLINACQDAIERVQALGIVGTAAKPRLTGLTFQIAVTWRQGVSTDTRNSIRQQIQNALSEYVNNLGIGEQFIVNEAIQRVMEVDNRILNIGTAQKAFDNISIYKQSKLRENKVKEELLTDYSSDSDERIIIEPSVETPILVTDKN